MKNFITAVLLVLSVEAWAQVDKVVEKCTDFSGTWTGFCTENGGQPFAHKSVFIQKSCGDIQSSTADLGVGSLFHRERTTATGSRTENYTSKWIKDGTELTWLSTNAVRNTKTEMILVEISTGIWKLQNDRLIVDSKWSLFQVLKDEKKDEQTVYHCEMDKVPSGVGVK